MPAPSFLRGAYRATHRALGSETVTVRGANVDAVLGTLEAMEDLDLGASADLRTLTALYLTNDLPFHPEKSQTVRARGRDWLIHRVEIHDATTTLLTLHSPERRTL